MPALDTPHRQPISALIYTSLGAFLVCAMIVYLGFALTTSRALDGALPTGLTATLFGVIFIAAIVTLAYPVLYYLLFTYELSENTVTVNSGIIFRQHETIHFSRIQSIENERGPILMLFGLTLVEIWTASPNQHASSPAAEPRPDTRMYLDKEVADRTKDFMLRRPGVTGV